MLKRIQIVLFCILFISVAYGNESKESLEDRVTAIILKILIEQPSTIENWIDNRVYLDPDRITVTRKGVFISDPFSQVELPGFLIDELGPYLICNNAEINAQAQMHYNNAIQSIREAFEHSVNAGCSVVVPPVSIIEGCKAVEAFKNAAIEYIHGLRIEGKILPGVDFSHLPPLPETPSMQGMPNSAPIGGFNGQ